jgi:hypothetical protein
VTITSSEKKLPLTSSSLNLNSSVSMETRQSARLKKKQVLHNVLGIQTCRLGIQVLTWYALMLFLCLQKVSSEDVQEPPRSRQRLTSATTASSEAAAAVFQGNGAAPALAPTQAITSDRTLPPSTGRSQGRMGIGPPPPAGLPVVPEQNVGRRRGRRGTCRSTIRPPSARSTAATSPSTSTRPPLGPLKRLAPTPPLASRVQQLHSTHEESLLRPGDEEINADPVLGTLIPQFPFPVRIPSFLLDEHL